MQKAIEGINRIISIPDRVFQEDRIRCVYRIFFDSMFYVGSSVDVNFRFFKHLRVIRSGEHTKSVMAAFNKCTSIRLEIIAEIENEAELRRYESGFISFNKENEFMLNKHSKTIVIRTEKMQINQYKDGVFIKKFDSLNKLAKELGIAQPTWVSTSIKKGHRLYGFEFRILDSFGQEIQTKRFARGQRATAFINKKGRIGKYSTEGTLVATFNNGSEAARDANGKRSKIYQVLDGRKKTYHGFVYKYILS